MLPREGKNHAGLLLRVVALPLVGVLGTPREYFLHVQIGARRSIAPSLRYAHDGCGHGRLPGDA